MNPAEREALRCAIEQRRRELVKADPTGSRHGTEDGWPVIVRGVATEIVCDACGARLRSRTHAEARKALRLHRLEQHV